MMFCYLFIVFLIFQINHDPGQTLINPLMMLILALSRILWQLIGKTWQIFLGSYRVLEAYLAQIKEQLLLRSQLIHRIQDQISPMFLINPTFYVRKKNILGLEFSFEIFL